MSLTIKKQQQHNYSFSPLLQYKKGKLYSQWPEKWTSVPAEDHSCLFCYITCWDYDGYVMMGKAAE